MNIKKLVSFFHKKDTNMPNWNNFLPKKKYQNNKKKKILIALSAGGLKSASIFESMLAVSLDTRGHNVEFLLCDGVLSACIMCTLKNVDEDEYIKSGPKKICNSCFINSYKFLKPTKIRINVLSDYLKIQDNNFIKNIKFEKKKFEELKNFSINKIPVGEHAYAGALRYYGSTELENNNKSKTILIEYLKSGVKSYLASDRLFKKNKYDEILLNHGIYIPQGIINSVAKENKINVTNWCPGYRSSTFTLTRNETYHKSLVIEDNKNWQNLQFNKKLEKKTLDYIESRVLGKNDWIYFHNNPTFNVDKLFKDLKVDLNKPVIALLPNTIWDAQLDYPFNFFKNILEWIFFTIDYFAERDDIQLLIRVHPAEVNDTKPSKQRVKDEIMKKYKILPKNIFIVEAENNISTYPIVEKCNSAIIYATKMGIELSANNKPVIVCGEAFIRNKEIAIDVKNKNHYLEVLNTLPFKNHSIDILRARKYAYHFFFRRMIPIKSILEKKGSWPNLEIDKKLENILQQRSDQGLEKIIECFEDGSDFIFEDEQI